MRLTCLALFLLLAGCVSGQKTPEVKGNPIIGEAIAVTSLDAPAPGAAANPAPQPGSSSPQVVKPLAPLTDPNAPKEPETPDAKPADNPAEQKPADTTPAVEAPPPQPTSPEELACRKSGGIWGNAGGKALRACVHVTRDAGKECRKASQCDGLCLARSGTCAPIKPLFGCNEIFQDDGARVTLCID